MPLLKHLTFGIKNLPLLEELVIDLENTPINDNQMIEFIQTLEEKITLKRLEVWLDETLITYNTLLAIGKVINKLDNL